MHHHFRASMQVHAVRVVTASLPTAHTKVLSLTGLISCRCVEGNLGSCIKAGSFLLTLSIAGQVRKFVCADVATSRGAVGIAGDPFRPNFSAKHR